MSLSLCPRPISLHSSADPRRVSRFQLQQVKGKQKEVEERGAERVGKLHIIGLAQIKEGLVRETQEISPSPLLSKGPLTLLHSSSSATIPSTSFPVSALSLLPQRTPSQVITTTKEFCSSTDRDRIRHPGSTVGNLRYSESSEKTWTLSGLWPRP